MHYGDRNFTSPQVFLNLCISNAGLIIAAVGMTFVLITGGIDISIGSVIGVVCMMLAWMMEVKHMSAVVAIILVLAFGVIFGLVQGLLVAYLKIQPFIVTLGGMFFARGLTALISSDMISIENPTFLSLANYRIYFGFITYYNNRGVAMHPYIYLSVVIALLVVAISFVILRYTKFGRAVFAVGGNEQSALLMGLNPKVTKLKVYVLNGFLASLAGFAFCLNSCGGFVEQARGFEMDAIAAAEVVIGEPEEEEILKAENLRWIQQTLACADKYTNMKAFPTGVTLTNASGAFGKLISEYVIGNIIALYRELPNYWKNKQKHLWVQNRSSETIYGKNILILGTGDIGRNIAHRMKAFETHVTGIKRTAFSAHSQQLKDFDEVYDLPALDDKLPQADIVIGCLPETLETKGLLNYDSLHSMKKDAVLINVGRGSLIPTEELIRALQ